MSASARIGFMQGRLSPLVDNRIQVFPWSQWRDEYPLAELCGLGLMEWTLDQERLYENPLMTPDGRAEIAALGEKFGVTVPSLTGDCFMQAPFWKAVDSERASLEQEFLAVADACAVSDIATVVVPLVDNGRLETRAQEDALVVFLERHAGFLAERGVRVVFESDFAPQELARFIARLDPARFGINYDIGNSAALGFDPVEELSAYGRRVVNVHVKDRLRGGTTVPLGTGSADFETVFRELARAGFAGLCVLQTARASCNDHAGVLCRYRDMTAGWLAQYPVHRHVA